MLRNITQRFQQRKHFSHLSSFACWLRLRKELFLLSLGVISVEQEIFFFTEKKSLEEKRLRGGFKSEIGFTLESFMYTICQKKIKIKITKKSCEKIFLKHQVAARKKREKKCLREKLIKCDVNKKSDKK